jgi:hypothetical protein
MPKSVFILVNYEQEEKLFFKDLSNIIQDGWYTTINDFQMFW